MSLTLVFHLIFLHIGVVFLKLASQTTLDVILLSYSETSWTKCEAFKLCYLSYLDNFNANGVGPFSCKALDSYW